MATPYIVIGCPTTGGGQVITGNASFLIEGIPIACIGDKATCPKHQTVATIIAGDPNMQVMGKAAARVNDPLSCGCKLLPKQNLVVRDLGSGVTQSEEKSCKSENKSKVKYSSLETQIRLEIKKGNYLRQYVFINCLYLSGRDSKLNLSKNEIIECK